MKKLIAALMLFCFAAQTLALPPAMEADGFLVEAQQHIKKQDYKAAAKAMGSALELIEKHDLGLKGAGGITFYYAYADVANKAGDYTVAFEMVNRYLEAAGRSGAHYQKALELYKAVLQVGLLGINSQTTVSQVKALIDAGADVNARDKYSQTPLHFATRYSKNPEVTRLLIEKGADANAKDKNGNIPLDKLRYNSIMSSADKDKVKSWFPNPAVAGTGTLTGKPYVADGDTIKISGERIRLKGIDAPETNQRCKDASGESYDCGLVSTAALRTKIGRNSITCEGTTRDRYRRLLGICYLNKIDLNDWMVRNGYALVYTRYSHRYASAEQEARDEFRGLWAGEFIAPWNWRKGERLSTTSQ